MNTTTREVPNRSLLSSARRTAAVAIFAAIGAAATMATIPTTASAAPAISAEPFAAGSSISAEPAGGGATIRSTADARGLSQVASHQARGGPKQAAPSAARAGWDWRNYLNCIAGIGVPAAIAWFFVGSVGPLWLLQRAMIWAGRPLGGPSPLGWAANWILKNYARPVWNSCRTYALS